MNTRERFLAFAGFQNVDRVPRYAGATPFVQKTMEARLGKPMAEYFVMDLGEGAMLRPPEGYCPPDYSVYHPGREHGKDGFTIDPDGCGRLNHGFYHFTEVISPLRNATSIAELENYPLVSREGWLDDQTRAAGDAARGKGTFSKLMVGHMYESAWQIRGYEEFLIDLLTNRDWAELLLERLCRRNILAAVAVAKAGYDCLASGDDVANQNGMMFHPDVWRATMKPRWARVYAAARAIKPDIHIWYHSDGNIMAILDDLVEIGVTILNPVQPECMDALAIRKRFGKRLAFDGCIGTQTTFPFGTPADMRRTVHHFAEALDARHGGLMLAPTHTLEPEVPPENIIAFFAACDELKYG
jgi:uroporphyrinogen decarboxylase